MDKVKRALLGDRKAQAELTRMTAIRKWNERPEILTPEEIRKLEGMKNGL